MSISRRELIRHFEKNGFYLRREGGRHSIYTNGAGKNIPIKRHVSIERIVANALCKQAGIEQIF
jgi:predicted RNA binding protein YcfA (HicA-like mRNA interferase family)